VRVAVREDREAVERDAGEMEKLENLEMEKLENLVLERWKLEMDRMEGVKR
jgi:hypothetical protein